MNISIKPRGPFETGRQSEPIPRDIPHMTKNSAALRVLVVDDEPLIRWSLAETLTDRGFDVVQVGDGDAAVSAISDGSAPPEVVLLDFRLPDSNDLGLLTKLRELAPRAQVIMMTAYGTAEITRGALELGAYRVVNKPFNISDVVALVFEAIHARP